MPMFNQDAEIIRIMGWREWLLIRLYWREVRDWFLQIWFCHHNARVLADMEYRLGCVLSATTRGMSKAYYEWPTMEAEIYAYHRELEEQAVKDFKEDYECHCDETAHDPACPKCGGAHGNGPGDGDCMGPPRPTHPPKHQPYG